MARQSHLFVGVGSHVVALDPTTGSELWRTKLRSSSFVTISVDGDRIYAGAGGELFCLDASTGSIVWHNKLKGLGLGIVAFASSAEVAAMAAEETRRRAAAAAAAS